MSPEEAILPVAGLCLVALGLLWMSHRANVRHRLITALPTSRALGTFIGLVELKGTAETSRPLRSHLTGTGCVLYSWRIEEQWRRTVTERYTDSKGRTRTRRRVESGWTTLVSGGESAAFYLQDDTGVVLVHPDGAEVRPQTLLSHVCRRSDPRYYGQGPPGGILNSTGHRRFTETGIPVHAPVFVVGQARERADIPAPEIAAEPGTPMYLITTESEDEVLRRLGRWCNGANVFGLLVAGGAGALAGRAVRGLTGAALIPPGLLFAGVWLALRSVVWVLMVYNDLVSTRNRVRHGWSLIEVQLKRRHDLIPALVSVVAGLRGHERDVQESIARLRAQEDATPAGETGPELHAVAGRVRALAERYPELNSADAFLRLQEQLVETEQRIALARDYFNDIATAWNNRLEVIPDSLVAGLFGFRPQPLLEAEDFERAEVRIDLIPAESAPAAPPELPPAPADAGAPHDSTS